MCVRCVHRERCYRGRVCVCVCMRGWVYARVCRVLAASEKVTMCVYVCVALAHVGNCEEDDPLVWVHLDMTEAVTGVVPTVLRGRKHTQPPQDEAPQAAR